MRRKIKWISVGDRMPKNDVDVHVRVSSRSYPIVAHWMSEGGAWYTDTSGKIRLILGDPENAQLITHWTPLMMC